MTQPILARCYFRISGAGFRDATISRTGPFLFPSKKNPSGHQRNLTLKRAGVPYFRIYDLLSTHATRLGTGTVADEWSPSFCGGATESFQEVFSNEVAAETRSLGENESARERDAVGFWYTSDSVKVIVKVLIQSTQSPSIEVAVQLGSALE